VRALVVVMDRVATEYVLEVAATDDQQPVETLGADRADEALGVGVGLWRADGRLDDVDSFAAEDLIEGDAELAVSFSNSPAIRRCFQSPRSAASRAGT
jgi:hypothetical protein